MKMFKILKQLHSKQSKKICSYGGKSLSTDSAAITSPLQFINGQREQALGNEDYQSLNPATGEELCSFKCSGEDDVSKAISNAKDAFHVWSAMSSMERSRLLYKAALLARENLEALARVETIDNGKPLWEAKFDIEGCVDTMELYAGLATTLQGNHLSLAGGSFAYTRKEPLGVCGGIGAWNYPFQMASWKASPALACGNTMVFKPSPLTPLTAVMLAEIYMEAGLPKGCFNVIQGGATTGQCLSNHPDVAKLTFTGSVQGGVKVMEAGAKGIKHVTLELGGKSPLIIFEDAHLENAVKGALNANFYSQGQVCSNAARVYVHSSIYEPFVKRVVERTKAIIVGDPMKEDTQMGAIISKDQAMNIMRFIEGSIEQGATVLCGGEFVTPESHLSGGYFISPCVIVDTTDEMTIVKEEVFGPVMTIMKFETEDEVVARANNTDLGLAGGVFTKDLQRAHRVVSNLQAGSIYVNNYNVYPAGLPFGGYKKSGLGRENGISTMNYFTQDKAVYFEMNDVESPY